MNCLQTTAAGRNYRLAMPQYGWIYIFRINGHESTMRFLRPNDRGQYVVQIGSDPENVKTMSPARFSYLHRFHLIDELPPRLHREDPSPAPDDQTGPDERQEQTAEEIRAQIAQLKTVLPGTAQAIRDLIGESPDELFWEIEALLDLEAMHGIDLEKRRSVFRKYAKIAYLLIK